MSNSTRVPFERDRTADPGVDGRTAHLASVYEDSDEQLETVASFLRQGLQQNERCLYVVHDNTAEAVYTALRDSGVDVTAAEGSGALAVHTPDEVQFRTGEFDPAAAVDFWTEARERAKREGFEKLRTAVEMTWAVDSRTDPASLAEYEALLNPVLAGEDCTALCQYNRNRFPPEVISDVIHNHPLLVDDGTVTHNTRYEPPDQGTGSTGHRTGGDPGAQPALRPDRDGPPSSVRPAAGDRPVRVLLVDDEPGYADMVAEYLELNDGIDTVVPETDPRAALARLEDSAVDCVVSDYAMPGVDGLGFLELVRESHPDLPFLMLTGNSDEETAAEAVSAGVTDYFRKRSDTDHYEKLAHRVSNAVERYRAEEEMRASEQRFRSLFEKAFDAMVVTDDTGEHVDVNPAACELLETSREELLGRPFADFVPDAQERTWPWQDPGGERPERATLPLRTATGADCIAELAATPDILPGRHLLVIRDVTEREQYERTLTALHGSARDLLAAESKTAVAESIVEAATDILSVPVVVVYLFDPSEGVLTPAAVSSDTVDRSALDPVALEDDSIIGETFLDEDPKTVSAADATPSLPVTGALAVPLTDHAVCLFGETDSTVTDGDVELVETLTATAETALDRVERGSKLQARTTELEAQNRQLGELRQLNATVREIGQTVAQADTRTDIERGVCDHLSASDGIAMVRVSGFDSEERALVPREWAGGSQADGYLDAVSATLGDGSEPATRAAVTEEPVYVPDTADSLQDEAWRKTALSHGFRSVFSLPLRYKDISYGTLTVYAEREAFFDELSRLALSDLSQKVANLMNAVDHQHAVLSGTMTEATVRFTDDRIPLYYIASRADCSLVLETVTPQPGGDILKRVRVTGTTPATVTDIAEEVTTLSEASAVEAGDEDIVELQFSDTSLTDYFADRGVRVLDSTADAEAATFRLSIPDTVDVRELFEDLESRYGDPELVSKSEQSHADTRTEEPYRSKLTPRQEEVLQTAYDSGFFQSPRSSTGEDVADQLGVSPQTFYRHVRAAERKLFDTVFDNRGE